jgi:lipopolysaccharide/colanic/teichoic acid biosynthesis glycosyltransferase
VSKRLADVAVSATILAITSPLLAAALLGVWLHDFRSPFYRAPRMRAKGKTFLMLKIRSMAMDADRTGVHSTASGDGRITPVGRIIRSYKIDELAQVWNVLKGDMSLVGPRPQVPADADLYTDEENALLTERPGITDLASIVFADEAAILGGAKDPDLIYNQIIRPWKSRLALLCIEHRSQSLYWRSLGLTALALISRRRALAGVGKILAGWNADETVRRMARRTEPLLVYPPPGAGEIVRGDPRARAAEAASRADGRVRAN